LAIMCVADDAERFHASIREFRKKNLLLFNENARLQVLNYCYPTMIG